VAMEQIRCIAHISQIAARATISLAKFFADPLYPMLQFSVYSRRQVRL
jgi:hypothetical protein